ncbi:amidohydrolase family protein [Phycisphaerales bacterium AB-hyl4]|uniref:Amidohydrolase family protein n=1 Tax=Natronomicrosphaera hydrolytica TaxID=3242702 RepID=A0ABV4U8K7_9BACT
MIIDAHQHVFWHGRDDTGLIADLDEHDIDLAWLLTWEIAPAEDSPAYHRVLNPEHLRPDGTHAGIVLSDLIKVRNRAPDRFILGYCPHPCLGDAPSLLEAAHRMHGVRVCGEWKFRILFDDPRCLNLYRKAGELGMPVVLHLDVPYLPEKMTGRQVYQSAWYGGTVANLERALQVCPETTFIGHAPGFWREISGDADEAPSNYPEGPIAPGNRIEQLLERYPNLYADLSAGSALRALKRDVAFSRDLLERFQDRILFARDYYGGELLAFLRQLGLSDAAWSAIIQGNAQRLVPLDASPEPASTFALS